MTIFLSSFAFAALALALAAPPAASSVNQPQAVEECGNIDPQRVRDCVRQRIKAKEQRLDRLYSRALVAVEKSHERYGYLDVRTDPKFLKQSQALWNQFIDDDCTVKAAFGGGSNSAISDRLFHCYEGELDRRIEFLQQLANGTYGI